MRTRWGGNDCIGSRSLKGERHVAGKKTPVRKRFFVGGVGGTRRGGNMGGYACF